MHAPAKKETLVSCTARALGELSLEHDAGAFLGAEEDLLARLGVSRPTLRQAAKIAENDRLITVRRGLRGGFYATRPDADDAIRALARFLRLRGARLADTVAVSRLVLEEAVALACNCGDEDLRDALAAHLRGLDGPARDGVAEAIAGETAFAELISRMSGNPVIEVVVAIGFSFGMQEESSRLLREAGQREASREMRRGLCLAVLARDAEIARLLMRRRTEAFVGWLKAHPAQAGAHLAGEG